MEMTYAGIAAMLVGYLAGRLMKLNDADIVVVMTCAGGGACLVGLPYLWMADIVVGQSGSLMWFVVGAIGGVAGSILYAITRYLDDIVRLLKENGLL